MTIRGKGITVELDMPNSMLELNDLGQIVFRSTKPLVTVLTNDKMDEIIRLYDGGCCALCHRMVPGTTEPTICDECLRKEQARRKQ